MISGVVLAAGLGRRFGGRKVLATLGDVPLVRHVVDRLTLAGLTPVIVVGAAPGDALRQALAGSAAELVLNPSPDDGMSSSLRVGVEALPGACDAFVVALGDQPLVEAEVVRALVATWQGSNAAAVVPHYRDGRGNPVLFDVTMRRHLRTLTGDVGARALLEAMGDRVVQLTVDGDAPVDVDTPGDLEALGG